ncbi:MAG: hypothetical protein HLUCCA08_09795 [Rhodobacteraceae bacterium HLUCCA08]|nr:MAG: hypothetical protein HLUCCA08_09795 [Rhodobacteraceae bacterium HLUCCA08]
MNLLTKTTALCLIGTASLAGDYEDAMQAYLDAHVASWATDATLIDAIIAQNTANAGLTQADIDALDLAWRAEVGAADTPTITPVLSNPASDRLRAISAESGGAVTEIFIMDMHGLNVATSDVTSDYWQGDEAKFIETYGVGPGAVHFSEVELDESTQTYQAQISVTIVAPDTGDLIGAMTVGVNAESLM